MGRGVPKGDGGPTHQCNKHSHPSPSSSRLHSWSPPGTADPCRLWGEDGAGTLSPPAQPPSRGSPRVTALTPEVMHHIELPDLGEEPPDCLLVLLAVLNGPSPARSRGHIEGLPQGSPLLQRELFPSWIPPCWETSGLPVVTPLDHGPWLETGEKNQSEPPARPAWGLLTQEGGIWGAAPKTWGIPA